MIFWLTIILGCFFAAEVAFHLPFAKTSQSLISTVSKSAAVAASKSISDHWKERVMLLYACGLLLSSLKLAALCMLPVLPIAFIVLAWELAGSSAVQWLSGWEALMVCFSATTLYLLFRTRLGDA